MGGATIPAEMTSKNSRSASAHSSSRKQVGTISRHRRASLQANALSELASADVMVQWRESDDANPASTRIAIASRICGGNAGHDSAIREIAGGKLPCCRSLPLNARRSQSMRPERSAFAARHISQSTQLQESQLLDAESASDSNPVALTYATSVDVSDARLSQPLRSRV
jgi:hypothetical protein